jgi:preprotein translocase subunit YajC
MLGLVTFIAQASQPAGGGPPPSPFGSLLMPMVVMGAIVYFLMIRPQSREKKKIANMLAALKKNDRVVTIGGIIGTVVSVRDDEVTLKVDESNNTKLTFRRSAIQTVTAAGEATDSGSSGKS